MGDLILADFHSKTYHKPELSILEQMAISMVDQSNAMAEPGTEVVCEPMYVAPPEDCA